jgi:3-oxoacyl-[acyl-carrier protein] reductase
MVTQELHERVAVVTGASRGIGQQIAVELARGGARVFCVSTAAGGCASTVERCQQHGAQAQALVADVADETAVQAMAETVQQAAGKVDIVVNNAGVTRDGLFLRMSAADFDRVLAVNLRGAFLVCRAFARPLMKSRAGRIVNIASVVGLRGNAGQANYAASKAGLVGLSKSLAQELAGRGVTVNVVAPGFVTTDMTAGLGEDLRAAALRTIPLGRFGDPLDVAKSVRFLCGDGGAYITGQVVVVDGGMTM